MRRGDRRQPAGRRAVDCCGGDDDVDVPSHDDEFIDLFDGLDLLDGLDLDDRPDHHVRTQATRTGR